MIKDTDKTELIGSKNLVISHRKTSKPLLNYKHQHDAYEILLCNKGKGSFFIKDNNYPVEENSLFLIDKFCLHCPILSNDNNLFDRFVIQFKDEILDKLSYLIIDDFEIGNIFNKDIYFLQLNKSNHKLLKDISEKILLENSKKETAYKSLIFSYILKFIIITKRLTEQKNSIVKTNNKENRIKKIINYINQNLEKDISLNQIAEQFNISKYYLCRYFKKKTGFTVIEFINNSRIIKAQKLLINSNLRITDIGIKVGFNSLSHFERTFKKINGITPSQYRNINK